MALLSRLRENVTVLKEIGSCRMFFGYTYIERSITGRVENNSFERFDSFDDCCAAAQKTMDGADNDGIVKIQIVPCEYDECRCTPSVMTVLKTIKRPL